MGKTSPNNKIRKVTKTTSTANFKIGEAIVEKTSSNENENKITIEICKKLLATNIVAKSFLGFDKSLLTTECFEGFCSNKSARFFLESEKSATSAAATIAVQKSKMQIPTIPKIKLVSKFEN